MKIFRCEWSRDVTGFYVTPLVGVSKQGQWSAWIGWGPFLWQVYFGKQR